MTPRNPTRRLSGLTLVTGAGALALVGAGLLTMASQHATPATPAPPVRVTASAATSQPTRASSATATPAPTQRAPSAVRAAGASASELPPPGSGPAGDPAIQRALESATAADLPPHTAKALVALGRQVWTAEATGNGRERWPTYFGDHASGATWLYSRFRLQAAVARRDAAAPGRAVVRLVWAGADPSGSFLEDRTATVTFTRTGATWTPVR